ncbi:MAG: SigE family RNA polymerase sigma factor [Actinobacteria bacterium]|nr:SigE family RNA polymerase sigma factor [Actinomycetota bacterium]
MSSRAASFDSYVLDRRTPLVRYATLLTGSRVDAEDVVQEVLIRLYPRWDRVLATAGDADAYVRRAVVNDVISWRRRWSTRNIRPVPAEHLPDRPTPTADEHEADQRIWSTISALPARQRAAIVLHYYDDADDETIAALLGCRLATVRSLISRGLGRVRACVRR